MYFSIGEDRWPVEVYPNLGDMLGGYPVYVSGPCFRTQDNIRIIIGDTEVVATIPPGEKDENRAVRAEMIMPYMNKTGDLDVIISRNGGLSFSNLKHKFPVGRLQHSYYHTTSVYVKVKILIFVI